MWVERLQDGDHDEGGEAGDSRDADSVGALPGDRCDPAERRPKEEDEREHERDRRPTRRATRTRSR